MSDTFPDGAQDDASDAPAPVKIENAPAFTEPTPDPDTRPRQVPTAETETVAAEPEEAVFRGGTDGTEPHHSQRGTATAIGVGGVDDSRSGDSVDASETTGVDYSATAADYPLSGGVATNLDASVTDKVDEIHAFIKRLEPAIDSFIAEVSEKGIGGLLSGAFGGMFGNGKR